MKKLLVLILAIGLVMGVGAVFAGPVHNNGPGVFAEAFAGAFDAAIVPSAATVDIAGTQVPGDCSGFLYDMNYSESGLSSPNIILPSGATLSPHKFVIGAISAQEVIPVSGYSKPLDEKIVIINQ